MWIFMLMCCAVLSRSVMSNSLQPHGAIARQAPLVHEDSSGKTTGVGWHALFLPDPGIKPRSPPLWADSFPSELPGKPKNTGVGSLSLLQGIFPTQESNRGLLHCRRILYQLSYQGICSWQEGWHWFGPTLNGIKMSGFREWDWIGVLSSIFIHQREKM